MTTDTLALPAALGGTPAFPDGLPLTRVQVPDRAALLERLGTVLDSGQLTNGRTVAELEEAAAALLEVPHVVAVSNCTTGLMLVLQAAEVDGGRAVVMPGFTFSATAHAAHWAGGTPVFAEARERDITLDPEDAAAKLAAADRPAALMATHVYGTPARSSASRTSPTPPGCRWCTTPRTASAAAARACRSATSATPRCSR